VTCSSLYRDFFIASPSPKRPAGSDLTPLFTRREKLGQRHDQPQGRNEVWSADLVFDRTAEGRVLKCLTIVDDATTEAVAICPGSVGDRARSARRAHERV